MNAVSWVTFNRRIADRVAPLLARTWLRPNHITLAAMCCGIGGALAMSSGTRAGMIGMALAVHASFILDNCDGQVARIKSMSSEFGRWFDYLADLVVDVSLWVGAAVGAYRAYPSGWWAVVCLLAVVGSVLNFRRVVGMRKQKPKPASVTAPNPENDVVTALSDDGDPSVLIWGIALIGAPAVFLVAGCVYINLLAALARIKR